MRYSACGSPALHSRCSRQIPQTSTQSTCKKSKETTLYATLPTIPSVLPALLFYPSLLTILRPSLHTITSFLPMPLLKPSRSFLLVPSRKDYKTRAFLHLYRAQPLHAPANITTIFPFACLTLSLHTDYPTVFSALCSFPSYQYLQNNLPASHLTLLCCCQTHTYKYDFFFFFL